MYVAVSKGTNNHILPMAYGVVDEEIIVRIGFFSNSGIMLHKINNYVLSKHISRNYSCNEQLRRMERAICISSVLFVTC